MSDPELYRGYHRDEAIALFDIGGQTHSSEGGWAILPDAILCLADVDGLPGGSSFASGSRFHWVADRPGDVAEGPIPSLPQELRGDDPRLARPIHLFARPDGTRPYLYLGRLSHCYAWGSDREHPHGIAHFDLTPTLPVAIWDRYGGASVKHEVGEVEIDRLIASLWTSPGVTHRLHVLDRLIDYWHGPWLPDHGLSEEELRGCVLPGPLRWIYRKSGRRPEVMSRQNRLLGPDELEVGEDGKLLFHVENQGVYLYATAPEGDDPPVWSRENEDDVPWSGEGVSLSGFLILDCLIEAILQAPYGASASWAERGTLDRVTAPLRAFPLGPLQFPADPTRFWSGGGTFVFSCPNGELEGEPGFSIWVGARTERPLAYLRSIPDESWDYTAF